MNEWRKEERPRSLVLQYECTSEQWFRQPGYKLHVSETQTAATTAVSSM